MSLLDLVYMGCRIGATRAGTEDGIGTRKEASGKGSVAVDGDIR